MILTGSNRRRIKNALQCGDGYRVEAALLVCARYCEDLPEVAPFVLDLVLEGKSARVRNLAGRVMLGLPFFAAFKAVEAATGRDRLMELAEEHKNDIWASRMDALGRLDVNAPERETDEILAEVFGTIVWRLMPIGPTEDDQTFSGYGEYILTRHPHEDEDDQYD